jgi:hypothetical protein
MQFGQPDTLTSEPYNPQSLNRYSYALNRPTVLADPSGHIACQAVPGGCNLKKPVPTDPCQIDPDRPACNGISGGTSLPADPVNTKTNIESGFSANSLHKDMGCKTIGLSTAACSNIIQLLGYATYGMDLVSLIISLAEAGISDFFYGAAIFISIVQPEASLELIYSSIKMDYYIATAGGVYENTLGYLSLGTSALSDWLAGYTYADASGFYLGTDTIYSARNALLGTIPESNVDLFVSGLQLTYDDDRMSGKRSGDSIKVTNITSLLKLILNP